MFLIIMIFVEFVIVIRSFIHAKKTLGADILLSICHSNNGSTKSKIVILQILEIKNSLNIEESLLFYSQRFIWQSDKIFMAFSNP